MAGAKLCWPKTMCLFLLISHANAEIIYDHNLLAVSHSSPAGIQVSLTSSHGGELFHEQFSNLSLPLECGENFSRCENLLVVSNKLDKNVTQFVAAIPVTRAVLLLDIRDNGSALLLHSSFILSQNIEDCNPTAIFKIAKSIYTMCFNEHTSFLTVIELRIRDPGSIQKAFFVRPTLLGGRFFDIADQVSNFLSINSTDERYVVFASGNTLTVYAPINTAMFPTDIPIQCSPQRIEHASGVVVAYCSDRSLSVDIVSKQTNITFYNESGYPFICPNYPHIKLSAFQSNETYLQYQDLQGSRNFTKEILISGNGSSFNDSKCFGTGTTFFVYSDNEYIRVVNTTSGREINLLPYGYPNPSFLNVLGGRYLIIQEAQNGTEAEIYIFDSSQNLTEVVRTQSQKADLMAVILTSRSIEPSLSPTPTITADISTLLASTPQTMPVVPIVTPTVPSGVAQSVPVVVLAVVGAVVVMVVVVGAVIFLILRRFRGQGKRCPSLPCCPNRPRMSIQEQGNPEPEDIHEHEEISLLSQRCTDESDLEVSSIDRRGSEASSCFRPSEQEPNNEETSQMVPGTELPS